MTNSTTPDRLRNYVSGYAAKYPGAWRQLERFRAGRGGLPRWPDWCWCPLAASHAIVSGGGNNPISLNHEIGRLGALAAWRMTQGIYRFDSDVFEALWTTPIDKIPIKILHRLPEWCVYIEAPLSIEPVDWAWRGLSLLGWFAHLEWDAETRRTELRLILDFGHGGEVFLWPWVLSLTGDTVGECLAAPIVERARQREAEAAESARRIGYSYDRYEPEVPEKTKEQLCRIFEPITSVILYLCSEAADIADLRGKREAPGNPAPVKTKKGLRTFGANGPTTWLTGYRIGASLRLVAKPEHQQTAASDGTHASPRPHIRRAHWHTYWTGPKNRPQTPVLKWLPPIPVGTGDLVPTIRRVK